jgi:hypothetical protein
MSADLSIAYLRLLAPSEDDRRKKPRIPMNVYARLKCLNPLTVMGPSVEGRVIEISRTGMRVRANRHFHSGAMLQIDVQNAAYVGTVRYSRKSAEGFETGVRLEESIRGGSES